MKKLWSSTWTGSPFGRHSRPAAGSCPSYLARRTAEGKNPREIRRCLKRYIARQLYRTLATAMTPDTEAS